MDEGGDKLFLCAKRGEMDKYANLGRDLNVIGYDIGIGSITVYFSDGSAYLYGSIKPGINHVAEMQKLAIAGRGLNGYINKKVKYDYQQKIR